VTTTGALGVLLTAKQRQLIVAVRPLMDALITQAGFWVSEELYQRVLYQVCEEIFVGRSPFCLTPAIALINPAIAKSIGSVAISVRGRGNKRVALRSL
jgi:Domain of unknown function (DUF3368)